MSCNTKLCIFMSSYKWLWLVMSIHGELCLVIYENNIVDFSVGVLEHGIITKKFPSIFQGPVLDKKQKITKSFRYRLKVRFCKLLD